MKHYAAIAVVLAGLLAGGPDADAQEPGIYRVDAEQSRIELQVLREGLFKFFAHDHQIVATRFSGEAQIAERLEESSVTLTVEAASLEVIDPGVSEEERKEVQAAMLGEKVLDAAMFPEIRFALSSVRDIERRNDGIEATLEGLLTLHGVEKPVTVPAQLRFQGNTLYATGEATVIQTEHGIEPIRIAAGTVHVKDEVGLKFTIVAVK